MKNKTHRTLVLSKPSQDDIRAYAFHLYEQSHCAPDRDLDNWFEATACLKANIPSHQSGRRLHHHLNSGDDAQSAPIPFSTGTHDS